MNILGVNAGRAAPPQLDESNVRYLADGSAALVSGDEILCAAIEERHAKKRYAGGFRNAAPAALRAGKLQPEGLDAVGFSTCCDSPWRDDDDMLAAVVEELGDVYDRSRLGHHLRGKIHCVDHHDSHAMLAFVGSGFRRSLVCTLDGFGNRRSDKDYFHVRKDWWRGSFDRQTFYLGEWRDGKVRMERVLETSVGADEIGFAELYRAVTHYLGWPSYQYAGKTMALASYGDATHFTNLTFVDEKARVGLANRHDAPVVQIEAALRAAGYVPPPTLKRPATSDQPFFAHLAARLQAQLEAGLTSLVEGLVERYRVTEVAFGGGVAMNCVALGKLARSRPDLRLYVPPAPSDTGQGLGNALWLRHSEHSPISTPAKPARIDTGGLGATYGEDAVAAALDRLRGLDEYTVEEFSDAGALATAVADLVADGRIVALCVGRSEYGPRALGFRSILADARDPEVRSKVNRVKRRESFRPFAASVLADRARAYFEGDVASPFMSFALPATGLTRERAPGIVHVDGSTRIQTVRANQSFLARVIKAFDARTGVGLVLNTSFNLAGEPMVETPQDAVDVLLRSELDTLVAGPNLVMRRQWK